MNFHIIPVSVAAFAASRGFALSEDGTSQSINALFSKWIRNMAKLKSIGVAKQKKSSNLPLKETQQSPLHLALAAVLRSETLPGTPSSMLSNDELLVSLLSIIVGMQSQCLNGDMWYMGLARARKMATEMGVDGEAFDAMMGRLEKWRVEVRKTNPLVGMF